MQQNIDNDILESYLQSAADVTPNILQIPQNSETVTISNMNKNRNNITKQKQINYCKTQMDNYNVDPNLKCLLINQTKNRNDGNNSDESSDYAKEDTSQNDSNNNNSSNDHDDDENGNDIVTKSDMIKDKSAFNNDDNVCNSNRSNKNIHCTSNSNYSETKNETNSDHNSNIDDNQQQQQQQQNKIDNNLIITKLPNDKNQEYAFHQIERVHNYSKSIHAINVNDQNSNVNDEDEDEIEDNDDDDHDNGGYDDDDVNDEIYKKFKKSNVPDPNERFHCNDDNNNSNTNNSNGDDRSTPDHHARRPMNAFLIFCKRHRTIVRDKYKTLENRSITKILGDWWATLNTEEKACYTNLAKQYKDAFFSANPNFKWYKLPAPPLRTLNTRPANLIEHNIISALSPPLSSSTSTPRTLNANEINCDDKHVIENTDHHEIPLLPSDTNIIIDQNLTKTNDDNQQQQQKKSYLPSTNVGIFKLADETQMGGLNNLIFSNNNNEKSNKLKILFKQQQQKQTNSCDTQSLRSSNQLKNENSHNPLQLINDHMIEIKSNLLNKEVRDFPKKRKLVDGSSRINDESKYKDIDVNKAKSVRSCKGKKYQEFLNSGQITPFIKKLKTKMTTTVLNDHRDSGDHSNEMGATAISHHRSIFVVNETAAIDNNRSNTLLKFFKREQQQQQQQFNATDFDLEQKINSLPAQNFDSYLQRKRDTKKKKKFNTKRKQQQQKQFQNSNCNAVKSKMNNKSFKSPITSSLSLSPTVAISAKINSYSSSSGGGSTDYWQHDFQQQDHHQQQSVQRVITISHAVGSQKRKARKKSITRRYDCSSDNVVLLNDQQQRHHQQQNDDIYDTVESLVKLGSVTNNNNNNNNNENKMNSGGNEMTDVITENSGHIETEKMTGNENYINDIPHVQSTKNLHFLNILAEVATNHMVEVEEKEKDK